MRCEREREREEERKRREKRRRILREGEDRLSQSETAWPGNNNIKQVSSLIPFHPINPVTFNSLLFHFISIYFIFPHFYSSLSALDPSLISLINIPHSRHLP